MSDDDRDGLLDLPERFASWLGAFVRERFGILLVIGISLWVAVTWEFIDIPGLTIPLWGRVVLTFFAVCAGLGWILASIRFDEPEPDWNWVIETNIDDPKTPRIARATNAVVEDMLVVKGDLRRPEGTSNVYGCRWWNKDPENPIAHACSTEITDADIMGAKPSAVVDEVASLRATYEETHGKHKWVLDHLYMVVRKLDFRRSKSQDKVFQDHAAPSFEDDSIADAVDSVIPDELRPDRLGEDSGDRDLDDLEEERDVNADDVVDDVQDELTDDEIAVSERAGLPAVTDGGDDEQ